ncbi:hypothetical protein ACQKGC_05910 [Allorhizobium pseudoryzae]|uniref:hypothetical protein n=1 Tax=Allorhizobium pseudoryzae TaxID=379684 RepID=UPI003D02C718
MALSTTYFTGTASINAGETIITGQNTTWLTYGLQAGDIFWAGGISCRILTVDSNTQMTLAFPWPGSTRVAAAYEVRIINQTDRYLGSTREVLSYFKNGVLFAFSALTGAANNLAYFTGAGTMALTDLTSFARTLLSKGDDASVRTLINAFAASGGTVTGRTIISGAATGNNAIGVETSSLGEVEVRGSGTGAAMLTFHRPGNFASYLGLDTDNQLKWGGWSSGTNAYRLRHDGNFQPFAIYAAGGLETDLTPDMQLRLTAGFIAKGPILHAVAYSVFEAAAGADVGVSLKLIDSVTSETIASADKVNSVTATLFRSGATTMHLAISYLTVGRLYYLHIALNKNPNVGPIYPRDMSISALNF